jgi:glycerol-3-phosphate dehydrogenase (NAD(P)+)
MQDMKIGVLGAGAWGTALAITSARVENNVTLWSYDGQYANFDGVQMPQNIKVTGIMDDLETADAWLIATPALFFRETLLNSRAFYKGQPVIICTKGIEASTHKFMSEIMDEELPECTDYGILSGPQFAKEVAGGILTGSTLAGTEKAIIAGSEALKELYLEISDDVIGAEICGIGKNAVALVVGFASVEMGGENNKALIFTLAWNEVVKFGLANGAKIDTFLKLCGLGDLYLSATSKTSRNYFAGISIAKNKLIIGTVEGIAALNGLVYRASKQNINMPILADMREKLNV